jgi:pimeloyl-ACP methyl ester carboxylesterase
MADDLEAVRRALGLGPWVIWGMSGGSMIAQVFAGRHPAALQALILDSAGPCFSMTLGDPDCVMSPSFPRWGVGLAAAGLTGDRHAGPRTADTIWEEVPSVGWVLRRESGPVLLVASSKPSGQMRRVMPGLLAFDARPWLTAIRVPTLVLAGTADQVAPLAQLRALHEAIPGSTFTAIKGAGHVPIAEKPTEVAKAVRSFLAQRVWT